ncbi:MAG: ROK family protein [Chloroflexota bacterium]
MAHALGIDLGGTKILAGIIDVESGRVLATAKKRTRADHGPDDVMERLLATADEALAASGIEPAAIVAAGVGAAGQVDVDKGELVRAPNLPAGMVGVPIAGAVSDRFKCPVTLANDLAAAASGEAEFGAGKGVPDFVCIFSGTGIGGAIYQNGVPYRGHTNTAGELGHMVIDHDGRICGCGGRGHLEAYASRSAIVRTILAALRQGRKSTLSELEPDPDPSDPAHSAIRSKALAHALAAGDDLAREMIEAGGRYMAAGLASIINFYNPPRIILGGGLVEEVDLFFELSARGAKQDALVMPGNHVDIVKAGLGDNSGIIGAALIGWRRVMIHDARASSVGR